MGIVDKAKEMLSGHTDEVQEGVDKAADKADDMTGGKYGNQIDQGADRVKDGVDSMSAKQGNTGPGGAEDPSDRAQNMGQNALDEAQDQAGEFREDF